MLPFRSRWGNLGSAPSHLPGNCGQHRTPGWRRGDPPCLSDSGQCRALTPLPCRAAARHTPARACRHLELSLLPAPCLGAASETTRLNPGLILDGPAGHLPARSPSPRLRQPSLLRSPCCHAWAAAASAPPCPGPDLPPQLAVLGPCSHTTSSPWPFSFLREAAWPPCSVPPRLPPMSRQPAARSSPSSLPSQQERHPAPKERVPCSGVSSRDCSARGFFLFVVFYHATCRPVCRDLLGRRALARHAAREARCRAGPCRPGVSPAGTPAAHPARFPCRRSSLCTAPNSAGPACQMGSQPPL